METQQQKLKYEADKTLEKILNNSINPNSIKEDFKYFPDFVIHFFENEYKSNQFSQHENNIFTTINNNSTKI